MSKAIYYVARLVRGASYTVKGKHYEKDVAYPINDEKEIDLLKRSGQFDIQESDGKNSPTREDDHSGRPGEHYEKPAKFPQYGVKTGQVKEDERDTDGLPADEAKKKGKGDEDDEEEVEEEVEEEDKVTGKKKIVKKMVKKKKHR